MREAADAGVGAGSSQPPASRSAAPHAAVLGVSVTVPEYVDRPEIVVRTSANEVKAMEGERWAETLSRNASRTIAENLTALLPSDDVVMIPSRSRQAIDYEISVDLTRFEIEPGGDTTIAGRWAVIDSKGVERAQQRVLRTEHAENTGFDAIAAAMSRNLFAVSSEIAAALRRLPPPQPRA